MIYQWRDGARIKTDAQVVGERLSVLESKNGGTLTAGLVLDDARSKKSPLHPEFEWNNETAAEEWRLQQARHLLNSIVVTYDEGPQEQEPIRAFVVVKENGDSYYSATYRVLSDEDQRHQLIERALADLERVQRRYEQLTELGDVFKAINTAKERIEAQLGEKVGTEA